MAIKALNSAIVANYPTASSASFLAGDALMIAPSTGFVAAAYRSAIGFSTLVQQMGRFVGFSADDTARSGNTMILADPVGSSYTDSSGVLQSNNNGFYVVSKRAIGDFLAENVNGVTNPTAGSSGYEGPRRGVGVFNTPGAQFITDRFASTASSTITTDGGSWTPASGDLLTVAAASGNAGKLVLLDPGALGTDGIVVGRVDSYDSAAGLLYFTQLSSTG
jgi:hypothetical protein